MLDVHSTEDKYAKSILRLNIKIVNNSINKCTNKTDNSQKIKSRWPNRNEKYSISLAGKKMKTWNYTNFPSFPPQNGRHKENNKICWRGCRERGLLINW